VEREEGFKIENKNGEEMEENEDSLSIVVQSL
jgi:hypothetical protein